MISQVVALTLNGFREARRNRVTLAVALFAAVLLLASSLVTEVTVVTYRRVLTDFGLGAMSIVLVFLAIFLSSGQLSREIERRTLFLVVSKPISRGLFLVGRLAGNMLTLGALLLAMGAIFCLELALYGSPISRAQLTAIGMLWFELLVLSSIGFLVSSFSSQFVSAMVTASAYFAGHLAGDLYELSQKAKVPALKLLGQITYYVMPNLTRLNYRSRATYEVPAPASLVLDSIGYGLAYSGVMIVLAVIVFSRRDFK